MINTANHIATLNTSTFEEHVTQSSKPCMVLFKANWSGNAHLQESVLTNLQKEYAHLINFFSLDIEQSNKVATKFNVAVVPTLLLFQKKNLEAYLPGLCSQNDLEGILKQLLVD